MHQWTMTVNWDDPNLYTGKTKLPKKIHETDIAMGSGILNYELQKTQSIFITYMISKGYITKNEQPTYEKPFSIESKGDAMRSTFGPLFGKMKSKETEFPKDVDVMDNALRVRNGYAHHQYQKEFRGELDHSKAAVEIRDCINSVRKLNNRYLDAQARLEKEGSKKKAKSQRTKKTTNRKYTDEEMRPYVKKALSEVVDENGEFYWAELGNALKRMGLTKKMYHGKLSELYGRLYDH